MAYDEVAMTQPAELVELLKMALEATGNEQQTQKKNKVNPKEWKDKINQEKSQKQRRKAVNLTNKTKSLFFRKTNKISNIWQI